MTSFSKYHPIVLFLYFICVIFITMVTMNPIILLISLLSSLGLVSVNRDPINYWFSSILFVVIVVTNPIFSQYGDTILFTYFEYDYSLEALIYGLAIATMLYSIIFWFKNYNFYMTSEKFLYLFQRFTPSLALTISMGLKYITVFNRQNAKISDAQKCMGFYTHENWFHRVRSRVRVFISLFSWSLENGIESADSMKARGYGLKGKTNFSIFRFQTKDALLLISILTLFGSILYFLFSKRFEFSYYPIIEKLDFSFMSLLGYFLVFLLFLLPIFIKIKELIKWHYLQSKI